jgi:predicted Zn-dependent protease
MGIGRSAISIFAILPLWAQYDATGGKGVNFYRPEKEAALGKQLAAELRERTTPIENHVVQQFVDHLGRKLAVHVPYANGHFTFSVVAEDPCPVVHEPVALPGGYVFVPAALFLAAQDEADFAGMLAHAMAHIAERHGTRQATRGQVINYASVPLVFMGGWAGCASGAAVPLGFLKFQQNFERQADFLAVQAMARAGFDPNALVRYIERVQPPPPPSTEASTAPSPLPTRDQRIAVMMSGISQLPATQYTSPANGEFEVAREEIRRFAPPHRPTPPSLRRKAPE